MKKQITKEEHKPATIRRPGAETKVGGFPLTTKGFKASPLSQTLLLREDKEFSTTSLRGGLDGEDGGGRGKELRQMEAINWWDIEVL